jgi:hypothetical protein
MDALCSKMGAKGKEREREKIKDKFILVYN